MKVTLWMLEKLPGDSNKSNSLKKKIDEEVTKIIGQIGHPKKGQKLEQENLISGQIRKCVKSQNRYPFWDFDYDTTFDTLTVKNKEMLNLLI